MRFLSVEPLLEDLGQLDLTGIDWVITGGESGHGARPFDPAWALAVRDQCRASGAKFFHKQNGSYLIGDRRRSKKANGRLLDGRVYDEMPAVAARAVPPAQVRRRLAAAFLPAPKGMRLSLPVVG